MPITKPQVTYKVNDGVLLNIKNIRLEIPGAKMMLPNWIGSYKVTCRIGKLAHGLLSLKNPKTHDVFRVSLLDHMDGDSRASTILIEELSQLYSCLQCTDLMHYATWSDHMNNGSSHVMNKEVCGIAAVHHLLRLPTNTTSWCCLAYWVAAQ